MPANKKLVSPVIFSDINDIKNYIDKNIDQFVVSCEDIKINDLFYSVKFIFGDFTLVNNYIDPTGELTDSEKRIVNLLKIPMDQKLYLTSRAYYRGQDIELSLPESRMIYEYVYQMLEKGGVFENR